MSFLPLRKFFHTRLTHVRSRRMAKKQPTRKNKFFSGQVQEMLKWNQTPVATWK